MGLRPLYFFYLVQRKRCCSPIYDVVSGLIERSTQQAHDGLMLAHRLRSRGQQKTALGRHMLRPNTLLSDNVP